MTDLFASLRLEVEIVRESMVLLPGFADSATLLPLIYTIGTKAPFRHMMTTGGRRMNRVGGAWISERIELEDFDRILEIAQAPVIRPHDVHCDFGEQLQLGIVATGFDQLVCDLDGAA